LLLRLFRSLLFNLARRLVNELIFFRSGAIVVVVIIVVVIVVVVIIIIVVVFVMRRFQLGLRAFVFRDRLFLNGPLSSSVIVIIIIVVFFLFVCFVFGVDLVDFSSAYSYS
jgi:amino acid transporter